MTARAIAADEMTVKPKIESVGLFKNGLAVVRASFPVKGPGIYLWDHVPKTIHGTFWIESEEEVTVQSTTRKVEETDATGQASGRLQQDLAGKDVTVTLGHPYANANQPAAAITGTVMAIPLRESPRHWNTDYESLNPPHSSYYISPSSPSPQPSAHSEKYLILTEPSGCRRFIDIKSILTVDEKEPFKVIKSMVEKPVLRFDVRKVPSSGSVLRISWLTKGMAWMPSYMVDLTDPKTLRIRQNAVVRNESADLASAEIELISGFPSVEFGAVENPLSHSTSLASFFQQINRSAFHHSSSGLVSQQIYNNSFSPTPERMPEMKEHGEAGNDIHYESIGKHSLKAGDSLSMDVAAASSRYERVVEWVVPDGRDQNGRYERNQSKKPVEIAWDAVRFSNPFAFPMTTAAVLITENGKFCGQNKTEWVNPGQRASLRITRALSVQTESSECEEEGARTAVMIGGNDFRRATVKGRLLVRNFRGNEITMTIRREFSGTLKEADGKPESKLRANGIYHVNPLRQLDWTIQVPAGGEKDLTYRYEVLVDM